MIQSSFTLAGWLVRFLHGWPHRFGPQTVNKVDQVPDVFILAKLCFEGGHAGVLAVADAAEDLAVAGPVFPGFRFGAVGGIGNHVAGSFAVGAMASDTETHEGSASQSDRFFRVWDGVSELFGFGGGEGSGVGFG